MSKRKNLKDTPRMKKDKMKQLIKIFFKGNSGHLYNYKQVSQAVNAKNDIQKIMVAQILEELAAKAFLVEVDRGRYKYIVDKEVKEGVFERRSNGKNHIIPGDGGDPISVSDEKSLKAMSGDQVNYVICHKRRRSGEIEAEVVEITKRAPQTFVGVLDVKSQYAFLLTENRSLGNDIFIPLDKLKGGKSGEKALVSITEWPKNAKNPYGEVIAVLGKAGNNDTEMHAILAEFGLPYTYPKNVEKAADKIKDVLTEEDLKGREDFRGVTTFTIDPRDAKDFDDALSIRQLDGGTWEVGVHIADVTHYVTLGSVIDKEAYKRATSVYLVDRTIPMLPERLCNQICSLRPDEDKLCFSAIFELNEKSEVLHSRITRTVIRSNRRFTYEEAQEIIENGSGDYSQEMLKLNDLAQNLRKKRFAAGSINFDRHEVKFEIDANGKPLSVYFKISKEANKLVEEFMLLANRTVAESIGKVKEGHSAKAFVYRVHDLPDPEKMNTMATFIRRFGYTLRTEGTKGQISDSFNALLGNIKDKPEENLIETVAIRTMAKAEYSTKNIGHYGLAFDYYTHFTSPIRRYPDMMVHRLLERYMAGGRSVNIKKLEQACKHSSEMELTAASAERASIKYKQAEFLSERLGLEYDGVISGVTEWGLYVEINENKCEGLVPMRDLDDDYYEFDEKNYCVVGRSSHKVYRLGDPIRIQIARVDMEKKQVDFALVREK